jgi:hypothetical protein
MTKNRDHFEVFAPHTLLKHAVYGFYVERWSRILLRFFDTLRIVDACAGEGGDVSGNPGSPLIALRKGAEAARQLTASSRVPKRVELIAIEKSLKNFRNLEQRIGSEPNVRLIHGTLADVIDSLGQQSAAVPHLYFIDPFGVSPLNASVIRRALQGPRNEVFLLFAGPAIRRHFGAFEGVYALDDETPQGSLFEEIPPERIATPPTFAQQTAAGSSEGILDAAFGSADWRSLLKLPGNQRLTAAVDLYCDVLFGFGAKRVLPMPVLDRNLHLKYHLIYATKSPRGFDVMKDAMSRALGKGLVGSEWGVELGMSGKVSEVVAAIRKRFRGNADVPWREVKAYALEETRYMPWQRERLQSELEQFAVGGKSNARLYRFAG